MPLRSPLRGRLGSTLVLLAFVCGPGLPLVRTAVAEADGPFCRGRRCCCATAGEKTRFQAACPCDRHGEPMAMSGTGGALPAELPAPLAATAPPLGATLEPPRSEEPRLGFAATAEPPPRAPLS